MKEKTKSVDEKLGARRYTTSNNPPPAYMARKTSNHNAELHEMVEAEAWCLSVDYITSVYI